MLTTTRNAQGQLQSACDWWPVDELGRWEPRGRWVFVNQLDISLGADSADCIRQTIAEIARLHPWAIGAYWERRDKVNSVYRSYRRNRLVKHGEEVRV